MRKRVTLIGALLGGLAVLAGALGAHALKPLLLENERVTTFELAVRYQFYHALLLVVMGFFKGGKGSKIISYAALLVVVGLIFFSGSLYILSLSNVTGWATITPIGGVSLMLSWVLLAVGVAKAQGEQQKR